MAKKRTRQPTDMTAAISDTAEHYAIAEILEGRRNENSQLEYLIKWKDRPESEQSWQSVDDLFAKKKSSPEDDEVPTKRLRSAGRLHPGPNEEDPRQKRLMKELNQRLSSPRLGLKATKRNQTQTNDSMATPSKRPHKERQVDQVKMLRKRANRHEYLVKWKDSDDEEWIDRDVMITKHSASAIAYFETITKFKD